MMSPLTGIDVQSLLQIYSLCLFLNLVIATSLVVYNRDTLHKNLLFLWVATALSFFINGLSSNSGPVWITAGWSSIILITIATAWLLADIAGFKAPWKRYAIVFSAGVAGSLLAAILEMSFLWLSLPITLGAVYAQADATWRSFKVWGKLQRASKILVLVSAAHVLHILDYPFLRDDPTGAALGFTIAFGLLLAQSIIAPAAIIETIHQANLTHVQRLNSAFHRFVPEQLLKQLNRETVADVELGDNVGRIMAVMFCDIRGFTARSETMTPQEIFDFINDYLGQMEPVVAGQGGFIDKYAGDGIMALFPRGIDSAIEAAIGIRGKLAGYNEALMDRGEEPIDVGIGINTGPLVLGTIGNAKRMDGTVIGDAVNIAARLEELTKNYKVQILIAEQTDHSAAQTNSFEMRVIDEVVVRGRRDHVTVFEVLSGLPDAERRAKLRSRKTFEASVMALHNGDKERAAGGFRQVLETCPDDTVAKGHLESCGAVIDS